MTIGAFKINSISRILSTTPSIAYWIHRLGSDVSGSTWLPSSSCIDSSGNLYVARLSTSEATNIGSTDVVVTKVNADGTFPWNPKLIRLGTAGKTFNYVYIIAFGTTYFDVIFRNETDGNIRHIRLNQSDGTVAYNVYSTISIDLWNGETYARDSPLAYNSVYTTAPYSLAAYRSGTQIIVERLPSTSLSSGTKISITNSGYVNGVGYSASAWYVNVTSSSASFNTQIIRYTNSSNALSWIRQFGATGLGITLWATSGFIVDTSDNSYSVCRDTSSTNGYVIKLDSTGALAWIRYCSTTFGNAGKVWVNNSTGDVYVFNSRDPGNGNTSQAWVHKFNSSGTYQTTLKITSNLSPGTSGFYSEIVPIRIVGDTTNSVMYLSFQSMDMNGREVNDTIKIPMDFSKVGTYTLYSMTYTLSIITATWNSTTLTVSTPSNPTTSTSSTISLSSLAITRTTNVTGITIDATVTI